ncbi:MAG: response regulator, partial [Candidatus Omnitrophota bacterium]
MPGIDGYQVCRTAKTREDIKDIPIVMLTALGSGFDPQRDKNVQKAHEAGAFAIVSKPFIATDLVNTIEDACAKRAK